MKKSKTESASNESATSKMKEELLIGLGISLCPESELHKIRDAKSMDKKLQLTAALFKKLYVPLKNGISKQTEELIYLTYITNFQDILAEISLQHINKFEQEL